MNDFDNATICSAHTRVIVHYKLFLRFLLAARFQFTTIDSVALGFYQNRTMVFCARFAQLMMRGNSLWSR